MAMERACAMHVCHKYLTPCSSQLNQILQNNSCTFSQNYFHSEIKHSKKSVCLLCPKMRRRDYVRACSKSVLGG